MTQNDLDTKARIIAATLNLITKNKDLNQITMRSIAEQAEVGIGLINYHFQTKDNLVNQCVQHVIGDLFGSFAANSESFAHLQPVDKLKSIIKLIAAFMMANSELARISTLTDLTTGKENDSSDLMMKAYFPLLQEVYGDTKNDKELKVILHTLISTVQVTFLRWEVNKKMTGFDFSDVAQRNEFLDTLVDLLRK